MLERTITIQLGSIFKVNFLDQNLWISSLKNAYHSAVPVFSTHSVAEQGSLQFSIFYLLLLSSLVQDRSLLVVILFLTSA